MKSKQSKFFLWITFAVLFTAQISNADHTNPIPGGEGGGGGPIILPVDTQVIHCASGRYRYAECPMAGEIVLAELLQQVSHARCQQGRSFGTRGNVLWVDRGCRANFRVTYLTVPRDHLDNELIISEATHE